MSRMFVIAGVSFVWTLGFLWTPAPAASQTPSPVTFHKNVAPILKKNCESCHRPGQIGPFAMTSYKEVRPWARAIKAAVVTRKMPPWFADPRYGHFNNNRSLPEAEIETIASWVDAGAVEGNVADAPPPLKWPEGGFQLEPDVVVELPPFAVAATGVYEWINVAIPAPFKEDTWVTSVEILPGVPAVVHHMCFSMQKHLPDTPYPYNVYEWVEIARDDKGDAVADLRGNATLREGTVVTRAVGSTEEKRQKGRSVVPGGNEFCYLPGLPYEDYRPVNAGAFVPAGSDMTVSVHYTTNGQAVVDHTKIGFTVAKTPPPKRFLPQSGDEYEGAPVIRKSGIETLAIPPNARDYVAPLSVITATRDIELVWMRPHAHQRGRSAEYKLIHPDGREEILLAVPRYDFNWQLTYRTSKMIPKGGRIEVKFSYDNSTTNRHNPDPNKWVYYGGQSWEEMGTPNVGFLVENDLK